MEMIGKSDPYAVVYIRPLFKVKTKVIENNLNPAWNQTFELIAEDKETQSLVVEVKQSFFDCFSYQWLPCWSTRNGFLDILKAGL